MKLKTAIDLVFVTWPYFQVFFFTENSDSEKDEEFIPPSDFHVPDGIKLVRICCNLQRLHKLVIC